MRARTVAALLLAAAPVLHAQRDVAQAPRIGTARVSGTVFTTDETPQPVRRAVVSLRALHGRDDPLGHHTLTDDNGQFTFDRLLEGRYEIAASRASFVTVPYGATMPRRTAAPLVIAAGERVEHIRVLLARGAAITGMVRDTSGEPIPGIDVRVEPVSVRRVSTPMVTKTDDQGVYRVYGLTADSYVVSARPIARARDELTLPTDAQVDAALRALQARRAAGVATRPQPTVVGNVPSGSAPAFVERADFVPVFHPSAFTREEAASVSVTAGEERAGVDVTVRMMSLAVVSGQILDAGNRQPSTIEVWLSRAGTTGISSSERTIMRADGSFRLSQVKPGRYMVAVRAISPEAYRASLGTSSANAASRSSCGYAAETINVTGADVTGLSLRLRPCLQIRGRVVFADSATLKPVSLAAARLKLDPDLSSGVPTFVPPRTLVEVSADGRFSLGDLGDAFPGQFRLSLDVPGLEPGRGWWLESATANGRDILDEPLTITEDSPAVTDVVFTLSDRHTRLSGALESTSRRQPHEHNIVVFPTNRDWWRTPFRRVRSVRPDLKGRYEIHDLPPGEYFIAALTDLVPNDLRDPDFLSSIAPAGIRITIGPGEQKVQNLRLAAPANGGGSPRD